MIGQATGVDKLACSTVTAATDAFLVHRMGLPIAVHPATAKSKNSMWVLCMTVYILRELLSNLVTSNFVVLDIEIHS